MTTPQLSDRAFGFTFAGVCLLIAAVGWVFFDRVNYWALNAAIVFTALAVVIPGLLMPLNRLWAWIAPKIASVNNTIVLGLVFYFFVTPIGLMMRLFGRDPMHRSMNEKVSTYWSPVRRQADSESFFDQF